MFEEVVAAEEFVLLSSAKRLMYFWTASRSSSPYQNKVLSFTV